MLMWGVLVCVSRVALGRHHVLDVMVGVVLGVMYVLMWGGGVWLGEGAAAAVRQFLRSLGGGVKLAAGVQSNLAG